MDMTMYDIVDGELTILMTIEDTNCFCVRKSEWPDSAFYLTYNENKSGYDRISITFFGDNNEDIGFWCGAYYYSTTIDNRTYYIKYHIAKVSLVDLDDDTRRIVSLKHENVFKDLSLENLRMIIANDGARGVLQYIDAKLRSIR